jgi:hypothetical protein
LEHRKHELIIPLNAILEQNYLQLNNQVNEQDEGLAMGAPTSAVLAETFILYLEYTKITKILNKHQIIYYYRYVDDILILYNTHTANIENTLTEFNIIHPKIKFSIEKETHDKLNYLNLAITNKQNQLTFGICWKPTTTDIIIHNNS